MPTYCFLIRTKPMKPLTDDEPIPLDHFGRREQLGFMDYLVTADTPEEAKEKADAYQKMFDDLNKNLE